MLARVSRATCRGMTCSPGCDGHSLCFRFTLKLPEHYGFRGKSLSEVAHLAEASDGQRTRFLNGLKAFLIYIWEYTLKGRLDERVTATTLFNKWTVVRSHLKIAASFHFTDAEHRAIKEVSRTAR